MAKDRLVSTAVLRERRDKLREQIAEQKSVRSNDDPFFKITDWLLAEWEQAEKDAAREWVPTVRAAELTGWTEETLRKMGAKARAGEPMPEAWDQLQARRAGGGSGEWSFVVSTIPVKRTEAA